MARLGVCLYSVGYGCLWISSRRLAHGTGTVSAYVAGVKNGVWWEEEEETGSNVRALPDDGAGGDRDTRRERGLSTCGAASLSATPTAWRALVLHLSLCTSHQFSKPSPEKIRLGSGEEETAAERLAMGMGMGMGMLLLFFPIKIVCCLPRSAASSEEATYLPTVLIGFF